MRKSARPLPFYARFANILFIVVMLLAICYVGQGILSPLLLSLLFAILLRPVAAFLNERLKVPNMLACLIAVFIFVIFFAVLFYFITYQVGVWLRTGIR